MPCCGPCIGYHLRVNYRQLFFYSFTYFTVTKNGSFFCKTLKFTSTSPSSWTDLGYPVLPAGRPQISRKRLNVSHGPCKLKTINRGSSSPTIALVVGRPSYRHSLDKRLVLPVKYLTQLEPFDVHGSPRCDYTNDRRKTPCVSGFRLWKSSTPPLRHPWWSTLFWLLLIPYFT